MEHRSSSELGVALNLVGQQELKDGLVSIGAILDRLAGITGQDTKANIRSSLGGIEKELRDVAEKYGDVVRSLDELAEADGWDNAVASSYQRLSAAYFTLLDDPNYAIELIKQARELARDPQLLQSMEGDRENIQQVQQATLCRDADASIRSGNFDWAEHLLQAALVISTEEQKLAIKTMQERCRRARALRGVDTTRDNPIVSTIHAFGPSFFGEREFDQATGSYVANQWLTFLFVPIFPLGAYRVADADGEAYSVLGRVPLPASLKKARWAIALSVIVLVLIPLAIPRHGTPANIVEAPPNHAEPAKAPAPLPISAPPAASPIEKEKAAPRPLDSQGDPALQERKRKLDVEGANLENEKTYLAGVEASYQREKVPDDGHALYESVFAAYNRRMDKYKRDLSQWKKDFAATQPKGPDQ
jgi:tetratricopeptide (TPR) repeat protein